MLTKIINIYFKIKYLLKIFVLFSINLNMSVALLVGMKYQREPRELPGIVLDLYRIYQCVQ